MYTFTNQFISKDKNTEFLKATMIGPNAMRVAEELASHLNINKNMRILDLDCGCGLFTLLLAKKYGASVFAADLWISPTENYERFKSIGIDEVARTIHSLAWWKDLWSEAEDIEIVDIREMNCCKQAWDEWLTSPNPYAVNDIKMMEAEGGKYFNLVQLIIKVI